MEVIYLSMGYICLSLYENQVMYKMGFNNNFKLDLTNQKKASVIVVRRNY